MIASLPAMGGHRRRLGALAVIAFASLGFGEAALACGQDGIPSLSANAVLAHRNTVPPTGESLDRWAQFIFPAQYHVGQAVRFAENRQELRQTLPPEAFGHPWRWGFGDGAMAMGYTVTHAYKRAGAYKLLVFAYYPSMHTWYELDDALVRVTAAHR